MNSSSIKNPWVASLLTFLTIGLGHVYVGAGGRGILLFVASFTLSYLAILAGSVDQLIPTVSLILFTGIGCYFYAIIDVLKIIPHVQGKTFKKYSKWYIYFLFYLVNSIFFSPILSSTFVDTLGSAYAIIDDSMKPTIIDGDHLFLENSPEMELFAGDIIVFNSPENNSISYIKRIAAVGGDILEVRGNDIIVNNNLLPAKFQTQSSSIINTTPMTIPPDSYYVLGDNHFNSLDSRNFGLVQRNFITGKARRIYWSWDSQNKNVRWDRLNLDLTE